MAELHVSKKNIGKLFSEMQNKKFVIPDYQRPYKWNILNQINPFNIGKLL